MAIRTITILVLAVVFLAACATTPPGPQAADITPALLLRAEPLTGADNPLPLPDADILGLTPEIIAFVENSVNDRSSADARMRQLLKAVITDDRFGLEFDDVTRTATETFDMRLGNCLSFTNMFIAMARHIGLKARYQEVDVPPEWTVQGDSFVLNRHVNILIDSRQPGTRDRVIDFNIDNFRTSYDKRTVTDRRAQAHYYSNVGVERMQMGQKTEALRYYRKAIERDTTFSPAWNNLGALYSRSGHLSYAEAAYIRALYVNPREFVAMSNLVRLYENRGETEQAKRYRRLAMVHRMKNPYYRYTLAREAFFAGDYDKAISHLKIASRRKKNEDTFYFLMGLSYLQKGDKAAARQWLAKAEEVAEDEAQQIKYHDKLEMLLSTQN